MGILEDVRHRPWPVPDDPWILKQAWNDLLFLHWPVARDRLREHVPTFLELDTFDNEAWVSVTPFTLSDLSPRGIPLLTFSSDLVFDGDSDRPYVESDPLSPLSVYGRSKAAAEHVVLATCPRSLVVRTAAFFGPWDAYNFLTLALKTLSSGRPFTAARDAIVSPTYVPDLVSASLDLLIDGERGVWHLTNGVAVTWADFGLLAATRLGLEPGLIQPCPLSEMGLRCPRPRYSALGTQRCLVMPSLESAIDRFVIEGEHLPNLAA